jgi:hypothetical protein
MHNKADHCADKKQETSATLTAAAADSSVLATRSVAMAYQTRLSELQSLNVDEMTLVDIESYCTQLKEIAKVPELKSDAFQGSGN